MQNVRAAYFLIRLVSSIASFVYKKHEYMYLKIATAIIALYGYDIEDSSYVCFLLPAPLEVKEHSIATEKAL